MAFLKDKQSRYFFLGLIAISAFLIIFGGLFCIRQTQYAKKMQLSRDGAVVSSLLEQGVSPNIIASAVANTYDKGQGKRLLTKLGYTENTAARFMPAVSDFETATFKLAFLGMFSFIAFLFALCFTFFIKREKLYRQAEKIILAFSRDNFTAHLPCSDEGTLYQLFVSVDNLASALKSKEESEQKTKEFLKNAISDISHQLKTPLAALNMYNEIISEEPDNTATVTEFSQKTTSALDRMDRLIQSLLKITRLDAGSIIFKKMPYKISEIVAQAVSELTTRAENEEKKITISGNSDEKIICDFQWTSEAVGNIIKNALDHTFSGGHIKIFWERSPAMVQISITDDGTGIAPEDIHHIFKRFYRSRNSQDTQGVGLGLSLVKSIVEGQGGILSVKSTLNLGTTFTLSFLTKM